MIFNKVRDVFSTRNTGVEEPTKDDLRLKAQKLKRETEIATLLHGRRGREFASKQSDIPKHKRQLARVDLEGLGLPHGSKAQDVLNPEFRPMSANDSMLNPLRGMKRRRL